MIRLKNKFYINLKLFHLNFTKESDVKLKLLIK